MNKKTGILVYYYSNWISTNLNKLMATKNQRNQNKKNKKLFKVRHRTNPYREEHTKLKGFENLKKKLYININVQYEIANLDLD